MRILFLTNFYPPHELGGQGQSCQQVVEGLKKRGHATLILTSMHGTNNVPVEEDEIHRSLYLEMELTPLRHGLIFFTRRKARERINLRRLEALIDQFNPDIVFIWGMWNLPRSLPALAEARCSGKVLYRFAEYWPTLPSQHVLYWRTVGRGWHTRLPKKVLASLALAMLAKEKKAPSLKFEHAICVSAATRDVLIKAGIPVSSAHIIHTGLDVDLYPERNSFDHTPSNHRYLELLYAGRLSAEKGIDTAIRAMEELVLGRGFGNLRLSIAGSGSKDFEGYLHKLVDKSGLRNFVSFLGRQPFEAMPAFYPKYDVLLVPSTWPEPLARVVLEGMLSGLAVVATPSGGTPEILVNGKNGLLFIPGDAEDLAQNIADLAADPELRHRLAATGRQTVIQKFNLDKMIDEVESYLLEAAGFATHEKPMQEQPRS